MKYLSYALRLVLFILLTLLTQIGGIVYIMNCWFWSVFKKKVSSPWMLRVYQLLSLVILYLSFSFMVVPSLAKVLGRVPLPVSTKGNLRPLTPVTYLLNRHYVRPELKTLILGVADELHRQYPGVVINYLDANFPFINGFPLLPHLSHNDGRKLDLAFCYKDRHTGKSSQQAPALLGYGVCEESKSGEVNTARLCAEKGYWQYSLLQKIMPQRVAANFELDEERTKAIISLLTAQHGVSKIFIEPHLVDRLKLDRTKIRFHGCRAVRHDDHIHVQIR